ncbi:MAG: S46 family peptidase, partial [Cyclobacteriaceae bacterium]|nr:S46 family peptidase [Cyclobacteriaceae bacterium]
RTFYSGGKYSLYGFRRYDDIRLVLYPELAMGYYGGDPDNFTFPRYNLDFTFYRAYNEAGEPLMPANYFAFNPAGAVEDEPVFVIGNPGSTGRYLTMAQLYWQRDVSLPATLSYLRNRMDILMKAAETIEDVYVKDSVTNLAFSLSNANKAYTGRLEGMYDAVLMTKKEKKENQVRANARMEGGDPWIGLEDNYKVMGRYFADMFLLSPNALKGKVNQIIHLLADYATALENGETEAMEKHKQAMIKLVTDFDRNLERALFAAQLNELNQYSKGNYIRPLLGNMKPYDKAANLLESSLLLNDPDKFFALKSNKLDKEPLMAFARAFVPAFREAISFVRKVNNDNKDLESKIMNVQFQINGIDSPPDATFSLRMADGRVKGYDYNGTTAPTKTTYFGLYDRHYSFDGKYPWNLPARWMNPPLELLRAPLNFVSTADIIGGNSGSPVINQKAEVVGLVFDGNIESLPGYFIFDDTSNRTVSVHAGGIAAAVKYIYKADRLLKELNYE